MGLVLSYRANLQAQQRWSKMERFYELKAMGLIPSLEQCEVFARHLENVGKSFGAGPECEVGFMDTAPSEYCAPEQEPA
jgi:hypothetical protein